jgi:hypothetical protein
MNLTEQKKGKDLDIESLREVVNSNEHLTENTSIEHLMEMSKLTRDETGLPVDIWIDEGNTFIKSGHGKRIKFQGDKSNQNTNNWIPLTINENPQIPIKNVKHNLDNKDLNMIKEFVITNYEALNKLGTPGHGIIWFASEMKKVN